MASEEKSQNHQSDPTNTPFYTSELLVVDCMIRLKAQLLGRPHGEIDLLTVDLGVIFSMCLVAVCVRKTDMGKCGET